MTPRPPVEANARLYPFPKTPVVVICPDGCGPDDSETAIADGPAR